jgi:hypothetical protein
MVFLKKLILQSRTFAAFLHALTLARDISKYSIAREIRVSMGRAATFSSQFSFFSIRQAVFETLSQCRKPCSVYPMASGYRFADSIEVRARWFLRSALIRAPELVFL